MNTLFRFIAILCLLTATACSTFKAVDPTASYQPHYKSSARTLGNLNVDSITTAPLQFYGVARLNTSPEVAYKYVSDLEAIKEWLPVAKDITKLDHSKSLTPGKPGQGTLRYAVSHLGTEAVETITYWEDGVGYGYSLLENPGIPMTDHLAVLQVESDGNGGTLVTYRQYFNPKVSFYGSLTTFFSGVILNRAMKNLADKFDGEVI